MRLNYRTGSIHAPKLLVQQRLSAKSAVGGIPRQESYTAGVAGWIAFYALNPEDFIIHAIARGEGEGLDALEPLAQTIYAISEAEVYCDMEGIDSLFDRYGFESAARFAAAFSAIGATEIANAFMAVAHQTAAPTSSTLTHLNSLVQERCGYGHANISAYVQQRVEPAGQAAAPALRH